MRNIEIPRNWSQITIEGSCALDNGVTLLSSNPNALESTIIIRKGTYINRFSIIDAWNHVSIGENCMIGPSCFITDANHAHSGYSPIPSQPMESAPVTIGDGAWLGAGVIVLKGVAIGRGAVIGANAVVTSNIPDMSIAVGVPARVVGNRSGFSSDAS